MRRLFDLMMRYRAQYTWGFLCLLATATLAMTIPWLLKRAVEVLERGEDLRGLSFYLGLVVGFALLQAIVRTLSRALIFNAGRDIEYALRNDLFAHLETLSVDWYQRQRTGDLMSRLVNDIGAVRLMLGPGILNLVNTPVYYVYAVTIMFTIHVPLTLLSLVAYPLVFWSVKRVSRRVMERTLSVQEGLATLSARAQENLNGMGVVKAYSLEEAEVARFRELNRDFRSKSLDLARVRGLIVPVMKIVSNSGILVVLWYGGWQVIRGVLSIGDLVAFIAYLHLLAWPTMALGWMISIVQRGRAAMKRLDEIFSVAAGIASPEEADERPIERGEIELENVSFAYPSVRKAPDVLRDVSLRIPAGSTVAVVGRTGAGKTSLLQLLARLFDVTTGSVRIDGRDVRTLSLGTLRQAIGMAPQDPFLFSMSLRDNIRYGLVGNGEADSRAGWAARQAGLTADLEALPRGLDTPVGERGITLSGGQRQRVALARALAVDPRILVLDDALSSVDGETEKKIVGNLREAFPDRTWVFTSHRVSLFKDADLIVVVDDGRVIETGTHEELLRGSRTYRQIFREQALETELEAL